MVQNFNLEDREGIKKAALCFEEAQESIARGMAHSKELTDSSNVPNLIKSGIETEEVVTDFSKNIFGDVIESLNALYNHFEHLAESLGEN